jgi:WD40 repeat protein
MSEVFVSYSRENLAFVRSLSEALQARNRECWVDLEGLLAGEEFWLRIQSAVEHADTFAFVITPDSVASTYCRRELDHAISHNKRIIPLLRHDVPEADLPSALSSRQWIFCREEDDFEAALNALVACIDADPEWVREHTRILVRAREWEAARRDSSRLLRGDDLESAELWLGAVGDRAEPRPTSLQSEYIAASRQGARRRQRTLITALAAGLLVAITLATTAFLQRQEALRQQKIAEEQRNIAVSRELSTSAVAQLPVDPERSILLAIEAVAAAPTPEADSALRKALLQSHVFHVLPGDGNWILGISFSADGRLLLTEGNDARVWEVDTGRRKTVLGDHPDGVYSSDFSADGRRIVTTAKSGRVAWVWNAADGRLLHTLAGHEDFVRTADFAPRGNRIATGSYDGTVRVWDADTGALLAVLEGHGGRVERVVFHDSGRWLLSEGEGTVRSWDARSGESVAVFGREADPSQRAVLTPEGAQVLTTHAGGLLRVWDLEYLDSPVEIGPTAIDFSHTAIGPRRERLVTVYRDFAQLWDLKENRVVGSLTGHRDYVRSASFSPDGRAVVTASDDGTGRIWRSSDGRVMRLLRGHTAAVRLARFSHDGRLIATASEDSSARIWRAETDPDEVVFDSADRLYKGAFSSDGTRVALAGVNPKGLIVDLERNARRWLTGHRSSLARSVQFSADGSTVLTRDAGGTAILWNADSGAPIRTLGGGRDAIAAATVGAKGAPIAAGMRDGRVLLWRSITAEQALELPKRHPVDVISLSFDPDGRRLVTASEDGVVHLWDVEAATLIRVLTGHENWVWVTAFSPDGSQALTADGKGRVRIWEAQGGALEHELRGHTNGVLDAVFSPDGRRVATAAHDDLVKIWDTGSGEQVGELRGHTQSVRGVDFSPDGQWLVTAGDDGTARIWNAATGETIEILEGHTDMVTSARFSPDGRKILTTSHDGTAQLHVCEVCRPLDKLVEFARTRVTRPLSREERQRFLHEPALAAP